ncbi:hypothetical protein COCMIDRAFT_103854 [Bipolaris oryzae ATCC 44560]|uniref:Uncharacterized protein n=1 Tax=Bipolaris oryzae ATCC 44560 TaxID=930090 RepID=W6YXL8_COCMI|nr:uncharacterized protein COCMIDRAFT_103854 [Bipolaris oryzae ATCC 44560]EUC42295.1 hypothetical protein COCMIDRAFT_103854 [Bipolaris oryzae ATCC 44560]
MCGEFAWKFTLQPRPRQNFLPAAGLIRSYHHVKDYRPMRRPNAAPQLPQSFRIGRRH